MRITTAFLLALCMFSLLIAGLLAFEERAFERSSVTATGVVVELTAGPLHAKVKVTPNKGGSFIYGANSRLPLRIGQIVSVRYDPTAPQQTAELASENVYSGALDFIIIAIGGLVFTFISPFLVRRFPKLLTYRI